MGSGGGTKPSLVGQYINTAKVSPCPPPAVLESPPVHSSTVFWPRNLHKMRGDNGGTPTTATLSNVNLFLGHFYSRKWPPRPANASAFATGPRHASQPNRARVKKTSYLSAFSPPKKHKHQFQAHPLVIASSAAPSVAMGERLQSHVSAQIIPQVSEI